MCMKEDSAASDQLVADRDALVAEVVAKDQLDDTRFSHDIILANDDDGALRRASLATVAVAPPAVAPAPMVVPAVEPEAAAAATARLRRSTRQPARLRENGWDLEQLNNRAGSTQSGGRGTRRAAVAKGIKRGRSADSVTGEDTAAERQQQEAPVPAADVAPNISSAAAAATAGPRRCAKRARKDVNNGQPAPSTNQQPVMSVQCLPGLDLLARAAAAQLMLPPRANLPVLADTQAAAPTMRT
eukprot:jgi/Chrzof1/7480/Cz02g25150.t1